MNSHTTLPVLAVIITSGIFFFYVNPTWTGSIAAAQVAIAADDQALSYAQQYNAQQNKLASERDAIDPARLALLSVFLPDSVDNVGLILDLNALAARSGLSVSNIDVASSANSSSNTSAVGGTQSSASVSSVRSAQNSPVNSVDLSLSASGTFSALQAFLDGVERSTRLLDVHDLSVKGSDTGIYTYQMAIRIYWLR